MTSKPVCLHITREFGSDVSSASNRGHQSVSQVVADGRWTVLEWFWTWFWGQVLGLSCLLATESEHLVDYSLDIESQ